MKISFSGRRRVCFVIPAWPESVFAFVIDSGQAGVTDRCYFRDNDKEGNRDDKSEGIAMTACFLKLTRCQKICFIFLDTYVIILFPGVSGRLKRKTA